MEINAIKTVRYRNVEYIVDMERELAFVPWILKVARASYIFLQKRGMLQPTQEDFGFVEHKKLSRFRKFLKSICEGFESTVSNWPPYY